jgi:hypothetical protein
LQCMSQVLALSSNQPSGERPLCANSCRSSEVAFLPLVDIVEWLPCTGARAKADI